MKSKFTNWLICAITIIVLFVIALIPVIGLNNKIKERIEDKERTELIKSLHKDLLHQDSIKITDSNCVVG